MIRRSPPAATVGARHSVPVGRARPTFSGTSDNLAVSILFEDERTGPAAAWTGRCSAHRCGILGVSFFAARTKADPSLRSERVTFLNLTEKWH